MAKKIIIDLGSGDGKRVIELAKQHPDWHFIGVDLRKAPKNLPSNVEWKKADWTSPSFTLPKADAIEINFVEAMHPSTEDKPATWEYVKGKKTPVGVYVPNKITEWLNEKGVVIIRAFPMNKTQHPIPYQERLDELKRFFETRGFDTKVVSMKARSAGRKTISFYESIAMGGKKINIQDQFMARRGKFHKKS